MNCTEGFSADKATRPHSDKLVIHVYTVNILFISFLSFVFALFILK